MISAITSRPSHHVQLLAAGSRVGGSEESQLLPTHLKFGMWASLALATIFVTSAKFYFDHQGTGLEVLLFCAFSATFFLAACTVSICRRPGPSRDPAINTAHTIQTQTDQLSSVEPIVQVKTLLTKLNIPIQNYYKRHFLTKRHLNQDWLYLSFHISSNVSGLLYTNQIKIQIWIYDAITLITSSCEVFVFFYLFQKYVEVRQARVSHSLFQFLWASGKYFNNQKYFFLLSSSINAVIILNFVCDFLALETRSFYFILFKIGKASVNQLSSVCFFKCYNQFFFHI